ncbi:MAG: hypothetical protein KDB44_11005 [Mycobacterium sp.]|nr:hypothetical protein [Mycobacterium sp.]
MGLSPFREHALVPAFDNRNRRLLSLVHHTDRDLHYLLDLARDLKRARHFGNTRGSLAGKTAVS